MSKYPTRRNLDGVYFRARRDDGFDAVCWTDLTDEEREEFGKGRPLTWWKSMAEIMTRQLRFIGDQLDIELLDGDAE